MPTIMRWTEGCRHRREDVGAAMRVVPILRARKSHWDAFGVERISRDPLQVMALSRRCRLARRSALLASVSALRMKPVYTMNTFGSPAGSPRQPIGLA
jgi:hypothetical protein